MGYVDLQDKVGSPELPHKVWSMLAAAPTLLASGNTGLVLAFYLRALCPLRIAFALWACIRTGVGGPRLRLLLPLECGLLAGFPADTPWSGSDKLMYRQANNAVPAGYGTRLVAQVLQHLQDAGYTPHSLTLKPAGTSAHTVEHTRFEVSHFSRARPPPRPQALLPSPVRPNNAVIMVPQPKVSRTLVRNGWRAQLPLYATTQREQLQHTPLQQADHESIRLAARFGFDWGRADTTTAERANLVWHWIWYAARALISPVLNRPPSLHHLDEQELLRYLQYEAGAFAVGHTALNNKRLAVRDWHLENGFNDPTLDCPAITHWMKMYARACGPAVPKLDFTLEDIRLLQKRLADLEPSKHA